jgi:hypothetical protein
VRKALQGASRVFIPWDVAPSALRAFVSISAAYRPQRGLVGVGRRFSLFQLVKLYSPDQA